MKTHSQWNLTEENISLSQSNALTVGVKFSVGVDLSAKKNEIKKRQNGIVWVKIKLMDFWFILSSFEQSWCFDMIKFKVFRGLWRKSKHFRILFCLLYRFTKLDKKPVKVGVSQAWQISETDYGFAVKMKLNLSRKLISTAESSKNFYFIFFFLLIRLAVNERKASTDWHWLDMLNEWNTLMSWFISNLFSTLLGKLLSSLYQLINFLIIFFSTHKLYKWFEDSISYIHSKVILEIYDNSLPAGF